MQALPSLEEPPEAPQFVVASAAFLATAVIALPALMFALVVPTEPTYLRICNATGVDLSAIEVDSVPYGDLAAGGTSAYKYVLGSFGTLPVNAIAGDLGRSGEPSLFCRTGEPRLPPGHHTLVVQRVPLEKGGFFLLAQRERGEAACPIK